MFGWFGEEAAEIGDEGEGFGGGGGGGGGGGREGGDRGDLSSLVWRLVVLIRVCGGGEEAGEVEDEEYEEPEDGRPSH